MENFKIRDLYRKCFSVEAFEYIHVTYLQNILHQYEAQTVPPRRMLLMIFEHIFPPKLIELQYAASEVTFGVENCFSQKVIYMLPEHVGA